MSFSYTLKINKRVKRLLLRVENAEIIVVSSKPPADKRVQALLHQHSNWIENQIQKQKQQLRHSIRLLDAEHLTILGKPITIKYLSNPDSKKVGILDELLIISSGSHSHQELGVKWLKKHAKKLITTRTLALAAAYDYSVNKVTVRDQSTRWGSCSGNGTISINWRLIFAPPEVLDYVIAHELAHLKHMNHSRQFWETVAEMIPNYSDYRDWLKQNSFRLQVVIPEADQSR